MTGVQTCALPILNASEIPQFEPGEKDAIALMFLEEAGTSNHYDYCSIFKGSSTR